MLCLLWVCAYKYSICEGQKRVLDPMEWMLQVDTSFLMGILGTKFGSSARAVLLLTTGPLLQVWGGDGFFRCLELMSLPYCCCWGVMCNDKRPAPSSRLATLPDILFEQSRGSAEVTDGTEPSQGFPGQLEKLFVHTGLSWKSFLAPQDYTGMSAGLSWASHSPVVCFFWGLGYPQLV